MSDYIKREDAIKQIVKGEEMYGEEFVTDTGRVKDFLDTGRVKDFLNVLPSTDVVECSVILAKADDQEKQGFIQTADVLRDLVKGR